MLNTVEVMRQVLLKLSFPVPSRDYTAIFKLNKDQGISEALFKCKLLDSNSRGSNSLDEDKEYISFSDDGGLACQRPPLCEPQHQATSREGK